MLLGLAALCQGLASEPSLEDLGSAGQDHHLTGAQLKLLLDRSRSPQARSAVLRIAAAQSGSQASADMQSRQALIQYTDRCNGPAHLSWERTYWPCRPYCHMLRVLPQLTF